MELYFKMRNVTLDWHFYEFTMVTIKFRSLAIQIESFLFCSRIKFLNIGRGIKTNKCVYPCEMQVCFRNSELKNRLRFPLEMLI